MLEFIVYILFDCFLDIIKPYCYRFGYLILRLITLNQIKLEAPSVGTVNTIAVIGGIIICIPLFLILGFIADLFG